jgi:hypothetical protein
MKKLTVKLLVLFVVIAVISGCDILGWQKYASIEGGFSVYMPAKPTGHKIILDTAYGQNYLNLFVVNRKDDDLVYSVSFINCPDALLQAKTADKILDDARDGAVKNIQGNLLKETKVSIDNYPGRDLTIESTVGDAVVRARIYLSKQRLYQIMVTTSEKMSKSYNIDKFFNSFKLEDNPKIKR